MAVLQPVSSHSLLAKCSGLKEQSDNGKLLLHEICLSYLINAHYLATAIWLSNVCFCYMSVSTASPPVGQIKSISLYTSVEGFLFSASVFGFTES